MHRTFGETGEGHVIFEIYKQIHIQTDIRDSLQTDRNADCNTSYIYKGRCQLSIKYKLAVQRILRHENWHRTLQVVFHESPASRGLRFSHVLGLAHEPNDGLVKSKKVKKGTAVCNQASPLWELTYTYHMG